MTSDKPKPAQPCPDCDATGWRAVEVSGVRRMVKCHCRRPRGFESLGEIFEGSRILTEMLTPKDRDIAAIIARRRGAAQAITNEEVLRELVAQEKVAAAPEHSAEALVKLWERSIKDSVRRLRRAGMKIGASRGSREGKKAVGYFVITTAAELAATVRPMLRQLVDEAKTIEALTGRGFYARELEGQMRMFETKEAR